jgi:hypothetical protein
MGRLGEKERLGIGREADVGLEEVERKRAMLT